MLESSTSETEHTTAADPEYIVNVARLLFQPGQVVELRCPGTRQNTISGYFDDWAKLAAAAAGLSGKVPGVYVTLNPVKPDLIARASNRVEVYAKNTTSDAYIVTRCWLPIDFDAVRPSGISSNDLEHQAAIARTGEALAWLETLGFPAGILADSANGAHLLQRVDLPNDSESTNLIRKCLEALASRFSDATVNVDLTCFNAARIWKLYGTLACKGDSTPDRPHRLAKIIDAGDSSVVPLEILQKLASLAPEQPHRQSNNNNGHQQPWNLDDYLSRHNITVKRESAWNAGRRLILETCPWNPEHNRGEAFIVQFASGALSAGCHHNSCSGKGWRELRLQYDPSYSGEHYSSQSLGAKGRNDNAENPLNSLNSLNSHRVQPFPKIDQAAFFGLPGNIVEAIEPYSEADPVAILVNILIAAGNCIGSGPHFLVEKSQHHLNTYGVEIGKSAKGRKGMAWSTPKFMLHAVDPDWAEKRIKSGLSSGEGLVYAVRDQRTEKKPYRENGRVAGHEEIIVDEGESDKRLLCVEEEFCQALKVMMREGNILSPILRDAWDGKRLAPMTKSSPLQSTDAHISIIAHITKDELLRYFTSTEQTNGFGNRFAWFFVQRSKEIPNPIGCPDEILEPLIDRLGDAITFARKVSLITRDDEAETLWTAVYHELSADKDGLAGALLARAEPQVMRFASIYALLDCSEVVKFSHLEAALALWSYSEQSVDYIFGELKGDPAVDRALEALKKAGRLSMTEIHSLFGRHADKNEIYRVVKELLKIKGVTSETTETGGRPTVTVVWTAN